MSQEKSMVCPFFATELAGYEEFEQLLLQQKIKKYETMYKNLKISAIQKINDYAIRKSIQSLVRFNHEDVSPKNICKKQCDAIEVFLTPMKILYEKRHEETIQKHKEERSVYLKEKIICECGMEIQRAYNSRHVMTKAHLDAVMTPEQIQIKRDEIYKEELARERERLDRLKIREQVKKDLQTELETEKVEKICEKNKCRIAEFCEEKITDKPGDKIRKSELLEMYKIWFNVIYGKGMPKGKEICDFMDNKYGEYCNGWHDICIKYDE